MVEPQNQKICCYDNLKNQCEKLTRNGNDRNCLGLVLSIILVTLAFVLGLIIGAIFSNQILAALPAVIVLAIVLALLLLLTTVFMMCQRNRRCRR